MPSVCTGLPQRCPLCPGWVPGSRDTLGQQVLPTLGWIPGLWDSACSLPGPGKCLYANMHTREESLDPALKLNLTPPIPRGSARGSVS